MTTRFLGNKGEQLAVEYIKAQGFIILAQNYKKFFGEIDIIAQKKNIIAFIEVKSRINSLVSMHELIPAIKQQKIIKVAQTFIFEKKLSGDIIYRFDAALIDMNTQAITYLPNAFCSQSF